eukprot:6568503-Prymnesium_polylepis.1
MVRFLSLKHEVSSFARVAAPRFEALTKDRSQGATLACESHFRCEGRAWELAHRAGVCTGYSICSAIIFKLSSSNCNAYTVVLSDAVGHPLGRSWHSPQLPCAI